MRLKAATALLLASVDAFQWSPPRQLDSITNNGNGNNNRIDVAFSHSHELQQQRGGTFLSGLWARRRGSGGDEPSPLGDASAVRGFGAPEPPPSRKPKYMGGVSYDAAADTSAEAAVSGAEEEAQQLLEAQREAADAEAMLKQAEEEAAKWERELADIEAQAARAEEEAQAAEAQAAQAEAEAREEARKEARKREEDAPVHAAREEKDAIESMAAAYQEALDAANDNVEFLSSQIASLEGELAQTVEKMRKSAEDKERISAEYNFLAKNFGELKKSRESEGLLGDQIAGYKSRIEVLEGKLEEAAVASEVSQRDVAKWKAAYDAVRAEMRSGLAAAEADGQAKVDQLKLQVLEANADAEEAKLRAQRDADARIDARQSSFDQTIENNRKMVRALRQILRKTRRESPPLEAAASPGRAEAVEVEDVRKRMSDEVANLRAALGGLEGEMGARERAAREVREAKAEREGLAEEMRELRKSLQREQSNSAELTEEHQAQLAQYAENEKAMQEEMDELDLTIAALEKERDGNAKQAEALKLELQVLKSKIGDSQDELETSNAKLQKELDDVTSSLKGNKFAMNIIMAITEEKIRALEVELETKVTHVATTEKAFEVTQTNLENLRLEHGKEAKVVASLQEELKGANAKLAQVQESSKQASRRDIANRQKQDDAAKQQIRNLKSQADALAAQLKAANEKSLESERKLEDYESRVRSMSDTIAQSSTDVRTRQDELDALKAELAAVKEAAKSDVAEQTKYADELKAELERARKHYGDSLAKANVEIEQRGRVLVQKERALAELRRQFNDLKGAMKEANKAHRNKVEGQASELREMAGGFKLERAELERQIVCLKNDITAAMSDAQKTVGAQNDHQNAMERSIVSLQTDIAFEQREKEVALQSKAELEKTLQAEIEQLESDLAFAQKNAADALQEKEREAKGLVEDSKKQLAVMEVSFKEKSVEVAKLESMVSTLTANSNKEIKLRQDALAGKEGVESMLQEKLDEMANEINTMRADAEKKLFVQAAELEKLEGRLRVEIKEKDALRSQLAMLKEDMDRSQDDAEKAIDSRIAEIQKMKEVVATLKEAVTSKTTTGLESALQKKVDQLSQGMALARANADRAQREAEEQAGAMASLKERLQRERQMKERIDLDLKAKIAELEAELKEGAETYRSAMEERDALLSAARADLGSLLKLKDEARHERDFVEKELTAQNYELKDKMRTFQIAADKSLKSKADEIIEIKVSNAKLRARLDEETEARDAEIAKMKDLLRARTAEAGRLAKEADLWSRKLEEKKSKAAEMALASKEQVEDEAKAVISKQEDRVQERPKPKDVGERAMKVGDPAEEGEYMRKARILAAWGAPLPEEDKSVPEEKLPAPAPAQVITKGATKEDEVARRTRLTAADESSRRLVTVTEEPKPTHQAPPSRGKNPLTNLLATDTQSKGPFPKRGQKVAVPTSQKTPPSQVGFPFARPSRLSAIVRNQIPPRRRSQERMYETRLGGIGNIHPTAADAPEAVEPSTPAPGYTTTGTNIDDINDDKSAAGKKKQEAFQRALLSARIANDANAKIVRSFPKHSTSVNTEAGAFSQLPSGLGQMVQDQNKQPTLSQQKAFANSNRRTSLFPAKTESHLSRLLHM